MNALTPTLEAMLLSTAAVQPLGYLPVEMGSNVGRDVKIRGSEFRTFETALYEYVINAYEGYDLDQLPVVEITVKGLKAVVRDYGVGMDLEVLRRYWMMHAGTVRRENGRNKRGYYGSGKSAFYRIAEKIVVETVRDGIKNAMSMTSADVDTAADEGRAPRIVPILVQQPVDEPNGTTITLHLKEKQSAQTMRALRQKIAENLRFAMTGAVVTVNGDTVEARPVKGVESSVASACGNFSATFVYNDGGHPEDDAKVFYKVGGTYIAAEQTGKEGHRFSHRVHVVVDTSKDWSDRHFEHRREHFISEARDGRLNAADPAAKEVRDFAEQVVREYMKKLEDEDARRRKEEMSEARKRMLDQMSRIMGAIMSFGGPLPRVKKNTGKVEHEVTEHESVKRNGRGPNDANRNPKPKFDFYAFDDLEFQYELQPQVMTVVFNSNSPAVKAVMQDDADPMRQQVLWAIAAEAIAELETDRHVKKLAEEGFEATVEEARLFEKRTLTAIHNRLADIYRSCQA